MDIKLICMDLDGTALRSDRKTFSPRLNAALEAAYAKGIAVVPVTGRQYGLLPPAVTGHPVWESLVVTCNGGQILRLGTGERLFGLDIEEKALRQLLDIAQRFGIPIEMSVDSRLHLTQQSYDAQLPHKNLDFHVHTILARSGVIVDSLEPLCCQRVEKAPVPLDPPRDRASRGSGPGRGGGQRRLGIGHQHGDHPPRRQQGRGPEGSMPSAGHRPCPGPGPGRQRQ